MRLELGEHVRTRDGQDVGSIDRLIMDPASGEVTAVVLRKGIFLPRDVEVPLETLEVGAEGDLRLTYTSDQVDHLPDFIDTRYTSEPPAGYAFPAGFPSAGLYWPIDYGIAMTPAATDGPGPGDKETEGAARREEDLLHSTVIGEGSIVQGRDGKVVGYVHQLTFDPLDGRLAALTVRKGLVPGFTEDEQIPASSIVRVDDDTVYLKVTADEITPIA